MSVSVQRTRAFIAACESGDIDRICALVAPDIFYHNIPMQPVNGLAAFRAGFATFLAMSDRIVWDTPLIAEAGNGAVLTERVDTFYLKNGKTLSVRVMGTFEFDAQGLLTKWRDYFDMAEFTSQMG
jgi:limonene-1,2-epoxide hydrolase